MSKKKEIYQSALNKVAKFLELNLTFSVYEQDEKYVVNAFKDGQPIAQNGEILTLLDKQILSYIPLPDSILEPLRELSRHFGMVPTPMFLEENDCIFDESEIELDDYFDYIESGSLTLIDSNFDFCVSISIEDILHWDLDRVLLFIKLLETLRVKKLYSISKIEVDLNDLNRNIKQDKQIKIDQTIADTLQKSIMNSVQDEGFKLLDLMI